MPRAGLLLLACALLLSSCGNTIQPEKETEHIAQVVAVTVPESLAAGSDVVVRVHWFPDCGDRLDRFLTVPDGPRAYRILPIATRANGVICFESLTCFPIVEPLHLKVPTSGVDHYRLATDLGDLPFDLAPGAPPGPEHRITVLKPVSGIPNAGLPVTYRDGRRDSLLGTSTDASGTSVVPLVPGGAANDYLMVSFQPYPFPCGLGALMFDPVVPLRGRAQHTVAFYGPIPEFHERGIASEPDISR